MGEGEWEGNGDAGVEPGEGDGGLREGGWGRREELWEEEIPVLSGGGRVGGVVSVGRVVGRWCRVVSKGEVEGWGMRMGDGVVE